MGAIWTHALRTLAGTQAGMPHVAHGLTCVPRGQDTASKHTPRPPCSEWTEVLPAIHACTLQRMVAASPLCVPPACSEIHELVVHSHVSHEGVSCREASD